MDSFLTCPPNKSALGDPRTVITERGQIRGKGNCSVSPDQVALSCVTRHASPRAVPVSTVSMESRTIVLSADQILVTCTPLLGHI